MLQPHMTILTRCTLYFQRTANVMSNTSGHNLNSTFGNIHQIRGILCSHNIVDKSMQTKLNTKRIILIDNNI